MWTWGRGSRFFPIKSLYRVGFGYIHGYKIISMPYPRTIGSGLGTAYGHKSISKPYPFRSDIHGYPCPWIKLPSLSLWEPCRAAVGQWSWRIPRVSPSSPHKGDGKCASPAANGQAGLWEPIGWSSVAHDWTRAQMAATRPSGSTACTTCSTPSRRPSCEPSYALDATFANISVKIINDFSFVKNRKGCMHLIMCMTTYLSILDWVCTMALVEGRVEPSVPRAVGIFKSPSQTIANSNKLFPTQIQKKHICIYPQLTNYPLWIWHKNEFWLINIDQLNNITKANNHPSIFIHQFESICPQHWKIKKICIWINIK